jgi:hypothetical protein
MSKQVNFIKLKERKKKSKIFYNTKSNNYFTP